MTRGLLGVIPPRMKLSVMPWSSLRRHAPTPTPSLGSIGAMHDDAELLEEVTQDIMESRRTGT